MEFNGKSPNGLNQTSVNSVSLFVSGASILNASSESVNVVGNFTASKIQTDEIDSFGTNPLQIKANTQISGSANISSSISSGSLLSVIYLERSLIEPTLAKCNDNSWKDGYNLNSSKSLSTLVI